MTEESLDVYAVYILLTSTIPTAVFGKPVREEKLCIVSATSIEEAESKFEQILAGKCITCEDELGKPVTWMLEDRTDAIKLGTVEALSTGLEVLSRFSAKSVARFERWLPNL